MNKKYYNILNEYSIDPAFHEMVSFLKENDTFLPEEYKELVTIFYEESDEPDEWFNSLCLRLSKLEIEVTEFIQEYNEGKEGRKGREGKEKRKEKKRKED